MAYSLDLSGRVALITGASGGLGEQFAKTLAGAGAAVVLASRRTDRLMALRAHIEAAGGDAHVVAMDVTDTASIKAAVAHAETEVGAIDILVNNSGVSTTQRIQDVTEEDYDFIFNTNTKGAFFVAQEVGRRMLARAKGAAPGTYVGGRIVNISSVYGLVGNAGQVGDYRAREIRETDLSAGRELRPSVLHPAEYVSSNRTKLLGSVGGLLLVIRPCSARTVEPPALGNRQLGVPFTHDLQAIGGLCEQHRTLSFERLLIDLPRVHLQL